MTDQPYWITNPRGHTWKLDEAGQPDRFALDYDEPEGFKGHNGPECTVCGEIFCEWCEHEVPSECPGIKTQESCP